jgi:hypothetical protein
LDCNNRLLVLGANRAGLPANPARSLTAGQNGLTMDKPDKLEHLVEVLKSLKMSEFTGSLKINFTQGGIGRIEKVEEMNLKAKKSIV